MLFLVRYISVWYFSLKLVVNRVNVYVIVIIFVFICILYFFMNDIKCLLFCLCFKGMNVIIKRYGLVIINF